MLSRTRLVLVRLPRVSQLIRRFSLGFLDCLCHSPSVKESLHPAAGSRGMKKVAKARPKVPDYCDAEPRRDDGGEIVWPAPEADIEQARAFITEW
jgi:hypothetical protein